VKITSFENKNNTTSEPDSIMDSDGTVEDTPDTKEELVALIKGLLFHKIDMPATSGNRSILSSLELIETKLNLVKNGNTYIVSHL
jgi:hypothetical protein